MRWTRMCFCGQTPRGDGGPVATTPSVGFPFLTGSEESRGPLYDETHVNHEGDRLPFDVGPQGRKIQAVGPPEANFPSSEPLLAIRLGDRLMATIPGEMSVEMGRRTRAALMSVARSHGVRRIVLSGYANEYLHYFTTPEEYEKQHYEGGSTLFGRYSSDLLRDSLGGLTAALVAGKAAPAAHPFDSTNGVAPDYTPYGSGAATRSAIAQPHATQRLRRASFAWQGGPTGLDRPLDRAFVSIERRDHGKWHTVADDLGLLILWRVDDQGRYTGQWQVPMKAPLGRYRFVVTANRYGLKSKPFRVSVATTLEAHVVRIRNHRAFVALDYPKLEDMVDLVTHFHMASGGRVTAIVAGRRVHAHARRGFVVVPLGNAKSLKIVAGRDRLGNRVR
jgi:neutral ceramidase